MLNKMFNLPAEREKNFICGLSMGGYGAMLLGLSQPEKYAGIGCFSGAVDPAMMINAMGGDSPAVRYIFEPVFGPELKVPENRCLYSLAEKVAALPAEQQPKILLAAGRQDEEIYGVQSQNKALRAHLEKLSLADYRYMEWDGIHEWKFWDRCLVYAIDYFLGNGYAKSKLFDWRTPATVNGVPEEA